MNFLAIIEDGTYRYLSVFVIGLYILGTLKTSGKIILVLGRLFLDVLDPICLFLCQMLYIVSFWPLNFLFTFFQCGQMLTLQLMRQLRYNPFTDLGCWIETAFSSLAAFSRKNVNAGKPDPSATQNKPSASGKVTKADNSNQFWEKVSQGTPSMKNFKLSRSCWRCCSATTHLRSHPSVLSKSQHSIETEISTNDPTCHKKAFLKFQLHLLPDQAYEFDQET